MEAQAVVGPVVLAEVEVQEEPVAKEVMEEAEERPEIPTTQEVPEEVEALVLLVATEQTVPVLHRVQEVQVGPVLPTILVVLPSLIAEEEVEDREETEDQVELVEPVEVVLVATQEPVAMGPPILEVEQVEEKPPVEQEVPVLSSFASLLLTSRSSLRQTLQRRLPATRQSSHGPLVVPLSLLSSVVATQTSSLSCRIK